FAREGMTTVVHGRDTFAVEAIDYVASFRPPPGLLATLPNLKAMLSLGAGIDGFLADPALPKHLPLVRFVDRTLSEEMAQYVVMHVLIHHRMQRMFDAAQAKGEWRQILLPRRTAQTRIGILGIGEIGTVVARHLQPFGFPVSGWSRTPKAVDGVRGYSGAAERDAFLAASDVLVCLLPLTDETRGILNADLFAKLPRSAFLINVARGGHLVDDDLIAAIDSGHLSGATLDVFHTEPLPAASPLWRHPKITVTPHVAAISDPDAGARTMLDAIRRCEAGEPPLNVVDLARGY
ncbi:MAG TPA: glyoxylate/hydroxypyruvate reductase A, partial [Rhizomicrobium sp.]|nr:glyoxylate/hydroxypyruvate reductase A [Rhizomicrobium sp.]